MIPSLEKISSLDYITAQKGIRKMTLANMLGSLETVKAGSLRIHELIQLTLERWLIFNPKVLILLEPFALCDIDYVCRRAKEAGAMIYVVTGSPSGETAKKVADKVFFVPASVYRGTDEVVPSFQPMGNLFEQCLLLMFDIIVMMIVEETPGLTFERMAENHRNIE